MKKRITPEPEPLNATGVSARAKEPNCPYNDWMDCGVRCCEKCEWNPVVAEARLAKIYDALEGQMDDRICFTAHGAH